MISFKQITYALAVEKTLHFKRAAQQCSVSQSALSTALAEMERQLGFQVFERDNKRVLVTPLGQQVLDKAKNIKLQLDDLHRLAETQKEPLSYPLSIGAIPTIAPYILPKVLPAIQSEYPRLQLTVVEEQSHVLVEMVKNGDLDTAILALPYQCEGLLTFEFWKEDFYWVTHKDDPSYSNRQEITSQELDHDRLMLLKDGHCLKDHALAACQFEKATDAHGLRATSLNTLIQLVAGGLGTTLAPEMALKQLIADDSKLAAVHLNEESPHRRIAFIVRPNYVRLADVEHLMKLFKEQLSSS